MQKVWQKEVVGLDPVVEAFETKGDLTLDQKLIPYDVQGSLAHAKMLYKIGILSKTEVTTLETGLAEILELHKFGKFTLEFGDEDIHSKIENFLTDTYGPVGGKIHTARSRNDQVLTAIRLLTKAELRKIQSEVKKLLRVFHDFAVTYGKLPMPGYTHMQKAMPSSIGLWVGSFEASLADDLKMLGAAYDLIDQSPLGSAAGFGVPLELDKKYTAQLLDFERVQENPIYCQLSRGKFEAFVLAALTQVLLTINKFASDVLLFTTHEFSFFSTTAKITTGSSIMPQKRNLDLAELLRSKVHVVLGNYTQIVSLSTNLISGYNRDLQDSKKPLIESLELTFDSLQVTQILLQNLTPDTEKLRSAITPELFATAKALQLVLEGKSFRSAYQTVGKEYVR